MTSKALQRKQGKAVKDRLSATFALDESCVKVPQVSALRASLLEARGIYSVRDILNTFPRRYQDLSKVVAIGPAIIGDECTIVGQIYELKTKHPKPKLSIIEITLVDSTGTLIITLFNKPWLSKSLSSGMTVSVSGKVEFNYGFKRMNSPLIEVIDSCQDAHGKVLSFYPGSAKLSGGVFSRIVENALQMVSGLYDPLPVYLRVKYRLCSRYQALRGIHTPDTLEEVSQARRRLIYEELFFLQLGLLLKEKERAESSPSFQQPLLPKNRRMLEEIIPFKLTSDQQTAVEEILEGMASPLSTNRLLLGDVGSGKTLVSLFALYAACTNGYQAAMMGPTEILVNQYADSLGQYLSQLDITWALLTGSTPASEKERIIESLKEGTCQVVFGTHALLEPGVSFKSVSFLCIDEQQRFGVEQRKALMNKAPGADILSLTATPIPRSLALALYGDTRICYLRSAPAQRGKRTTKVCHFSEQSIAYDAALDAVERGEQVYVVCPLIGISTQKLDSLTVRYSESESDASSFGESHQDNGETEIEYAAIEFGLENETLQPEISSAIKHAEMLQNTIFSQARVGLLHGKLSHEEKEAIMREFREGEIDVLVSTTVVEVGVDVPNATVMIVEDADRFGLAQLHQLRGRVGRGAKDASVFLVSRSSNTQALERLGIMEKTEDGFQVSEYDLAQRREGDIFGLDQHGASKLKLVNVIRDKAIIEAARKDAEDILYNQTISEEEYRILRYELELFMKEKR